MPFARSRIGRDVNLRSTVQSNWMSIFTERMSRMDNIVKQLLTELEQFGKANDAIHNVLSHPDELVKCVEFVEQLPKFVSMTIPVGKGLHIAYKSLR